MRCPCRRSELRGWQNVAFHSRQFAAALFHNGPTAPGDLWVYSMSDGKSHQLTHSLVGGVRSKIWSSLIWFTIEQRWQMDDSAFVYMPYNLPHQAEHPALVYVHGGPTAQTMIRSIASCSTWRSGIHRHRSQLSRIDGIRKKYFSRRIFSTWRRRLQDVLAAADWIQQTGYVDQKNSF